MDTTRLAVAAAVDDAAWRIIELETCADRLPPGDPATAPLRDGAEQLRRRIEALLVDGPDVHDDAEAAAA